jgi:hypothetical protein
MSPSEASILAAAIAAIVALSVFIANQFIQWHLQRKELRRAEYEKVLIAARAYLMDVLIGDGDKSSESRAILLTSDLLLKLNTPPNNDDRDVSFIIKHLSHRLLFLGKRAPAGPSSDRWGEQLERTVEVLGSVVSSRHHNLLEPMDTFGMFMGLMEEAEEHGYDADEETGSAESYWWDQEPPQWLTPLPRTKRSPVLKRWWSKVQRAWRRKFVLPRLAGKQAG